MFVWTRLLQSLFRRMRCDAAVRPPRTYRCPQCGEVIVPGPGETPRCPRDHSSALHPEPPER